MNVQVTLVNARVPILTADSCLAHSEVETAHSVEEGGQVFSKSAASGVSLSTSCPLFPAAGNNHKYAICRRFVLLERLLAHQQSGPTHCRGTSFRPIAQTLHGSCLTMVFNSLWDNRSMGLEQVGSFNRLTCMAERTVLIHN